MLPWLIALACAAGFVSLWFTLAHRELAARRDALNGEQIQLQLVREQVEQLRGTQHEASAQERLETEGALYREIRKKYAQTRRKPINLLPAWVLGFRPALEEPNIQRGKEK